MRRVLPRVLLRMLFGWRSTRGKEPWQGGLLPIVTGLARSVFGSSLILAVLAWHFCRGQIDYLLGYSAPVEFIIVLVAANIVGHAVGNAIRTLNRGIYKVADVAEKQIVESEQTQAVLKEREGLLSAAHPPVDEDGASLLRAAHEDEQQPATLLRRAQPPE